MPKNGAASVEDCEDIISVGPASVTSTVRTAPTYWTRNCKTYDISQYAGKGWVTCVEDVDLRIQDQFLVTDESTDRSKSCHFGIRIRRLVRGFPQDVSDNVIWVEKQFSRNIQERAPAQPAAAATARHPVTQPNFSTLFGETDDDNSTLAQDPVATEVSMDGQLPTDRITAKKVQELCTEILKSCPPAAEAFLADANSVRARAENLELDSFQERASPLAMLGAAGVGKSTLANQLITHNSSWLQEGENGVPEELICTCTPPGNMRENHTLYPKDEVTVDERETFSMTFEETMQHVAEDFKYSRPDAKGLAPTVAGGEDCTGPAVLYCGRLAAKKCKVILTYKDADVVSTQLDGYLSRLKEANKANSEGDDSRDLTDMEFADYKATMGIEPSLEREEVLAIEAVLPKRICDVLGRTVTFETGSPTQARLLILATTVGPWSCWPCLHKVQVVFPANSDFDLMDMAGLVKDSHQACVTQKHLDNAYTELILMVCGSERKIPEDAAIVLRGVPRLLKLLRDAKQNCITHTVRCASRDEGDILHLAQNMERKKGIEKAVEYLQKQLKDASKQQWANWALKFVVEHIQKGSGIDEEKETLINCLKNSQSHLFPVWSLDTLGRFSSQETPSQESTGLAAAIREKCSVQALFSALKEQQDAKTEVMKQRQSQEAWKLAMELFQLADMTISGEVLRNAQGKAAFRVLADKANLLVRRLDTTWWQEKRSTRTRSGSVGGHGLDKDGITHIFAEITQEGVRLAALCTEAAAVEALRNQQSKNKNFPEGLQKEYEKDRVHTLNAHLRAESGLGNGNTPLPDILFKTVVDELPGKIVDRLQNWFHAACKELQEHFLAACRDLFKEPESPLQDDAQQKALHVFLENTHLQLLQHTNTFRETATSKMDEYLNNLPRHVLNEAMDEAAKPDLHDVLDMKIGSKRANNSQRCKAMLKLAPGLADKVARKLVERVHQYTDKMAEHLVACCNDELNRITKAFDSGQQQLRPEDQQQIAPWHSACRAVCVELADYLYESQNEVEAAYERESEDFHNKLQRVLQQAAQYYNEGVTDAAVLYPPMQGPPAHDERAAAQAERSRKRARQEQQANGRTKR